MATTLAERAKKNAPLAERLAMGCMPEPNTGCHLWLGKRDKDGYGNITHMYKTLRAHRVAYELKRGPIPAGMVIDHRCRMPECVNPDHMDVVTPTENTRRGRAPAATKARHAVKMTCSHGHSLADAYVFFRRGWSERVCRKCKRQRYLNDKARGLR